VMSVYADLLCESFCTWH